MKGKLKRALELFTLSPRMPSYLVIFKSPDDHIQATDALIESVAQEVTSKGTSDTMLSHS